MKDKTQKASNSCLVLEFRLSDPGSTSIDIYSVDTMTVNGQKTHEVTERDRKTLRMTPLEEFPPSERTQPT